METTPATSASPAASRMSRTKPNMPEEFLASPVLNGLSSKLSSKRKAETPMGCHLTQMTRIRDGLIAADEINPNPRAVVAPITASAPASTS